MDANVSGDVRGAARDHALDASHRAVLDVGRPDAVAKMHARGHLTARERVELLFDDGSFVEHGALARPALDHAEGAADGLIVGAGTISGRPCAVISYDYTVQAGTQGVVSHAKLDHILELSAKHRWPIVAFAEGGGARAQEMGLANFGRRVMSFAGMAKLSGVVPLVGVVPGRSFGGHAALAGLCDIIVATPDAAMGIAGPPFVSAATGMHLTADELGPASLHESVGAVDVMVHDDADAVAVARQYLELVSWPDDVAVPPEIPTATLAELVPVSSRHAYDARELVRAVVDEGSAIELRPRWAANVICVLARIEGRTVGLIANNPSVMAGALDRDASDKMARFVSMCDIHRIPVVFFADTPGFLVGPEAESSALVRHSSRPILALAHATVPIMLVVIRKAFGLGYFAMGTRPFDPVLMVAWPSAEFGSMGHTGASALSGTDEHTLREEHSTAVFAAKFAVDDIIDPVDTRRHLAMSLALVPPESFALSSPTRALDAW